MLQQTTEPADQPGVDHHDDRRGDDPGAVHCRAEGRTADLRRAYTAIPYVRADTVGRGWLSDATFLDGIALAGVLPAPLVIFATFVGYVVGGLSGAVAITLGMFLPAFAFSPIFFERLEAIVERPALHRLLAGVAAAVVGIIAATWVQLGAATVARVSLLPVAAVLFGVALVVVWRVKGAWVVPAVLALAGVAGWAMGV